jgi:FkbM family methyltransferase
MTGRHPHRPISVRSESLLHRARLALRMLGLDISRFPDPKSGPSRRALLLEQHGVETVLDIGAATGLYGAELRRHGYRGRILSIEPLPQSFEQLSSRAARDPRWSVLPLAVGAEPGHATLHVAANADSSSLLPMLDSHREAAPESAYIGTQTVEVTTLAAILDQHCPDAASVFIKLDTQGSEMQILDAAPLGRVIGIQLELSLVALYEQATLFTDALQQLRDRGFHLASVEPGFHHPRTGQLLQMDGVFFCDH